MTPSSLTLRCCCRGSLRKRLITDAAKWASDAVFLRALDLLSEGYFKGPSESINVNGDAAVPLSSQQYPNVPPQKLFTITDGPAHWGETSDARVKATIEQILVGLGMQRSR